MTDEGGMLLNVIDIVERKHKPEKKLSLQTQHGAEQRIDKKQGMRSKLGKRKHENLLPEQNKQIGKLHKDEDARHSTGGRDDGDAKRLKQSIVSSLFRSNPDIPQVKQTAVNKNVEAVFSSDSFHNLGLHPFLVSHLEKEMKLTKLTSVQAQSIPHLLNGKDTLIRSQTGSGKTLSFVIPIVQELQSVRPKLQRSDGVHAIVLVPTRELALQCLEVFQSLVKPFLWLVPGAVMGGEKKKSEKARLRKGLTVLVATPGRLLDHIENTSTMTLSGVRWLILDEADRLLDMGFEKDIAAIVTALNAQQVDGATSRRQTVLLSATLTAGVHRMAGMSLRDPEQVFVGADAPVRAEPASSSTATGSEGFTLPDQLGQEFVIVPSKLRLVTLTAFILSKCKLAKAGKLLVFLSTQDSVDFHYKLLDGILNHSAGGATTALPDDVGDTDASASSLLPKISEDDEVKFFRLHGSMTQMERTDVFNQYKMAMTGVLLSTDVAARGLDMRNISWVVQYDPPGAPANYIHRIGRTARIGSSGQALLFLTPAEVKYVTVLNNHNISLNELQCAKILQCLLGEVTWLHSRKKSDIPRTPEEAATRLMMVMENYVLLNSEMHDIARKAYASSVRGYATHPSSLKHIFHVRNLHLGHVAKSFGLREAPKAVGHTTSKSHTKLSQKPKRKRLHIEAGKSRPRPSGLQMSDANRVPIGRSSNSVSEFGSGLSDRGKSSKSLAPKAVHKVGSKVVKDRKAIAGRRVYMKKQVGKSSTKKIKSASLTAG